MGDADTRARSSLPMVIGMLVGAAAGFGLGGAVYVLVNPVLEQSSGLVRELQGALWNLVPLLTVVGGVLGWWLIAVRARRRQAGHR